MGTFIGLAGRFSYEKILEGKKIKAFTKKLQGEGTDPKTLQLGKKLQQLLNSDKIKSKEEEGIYEHFYKDLFLLRHYHQIKRNIS